MFRLNKKFWINKTSFNSKKFFFDLKKLSFGWVIFIVKSFKTSLHLAHLINEEFFIGGIVKNQLIRGWNACFFPPDKLSTPPCPQRVPKIKFPHISARLFLKPYDCFLLHSLWKSFMSYWIKKSVGVKRKVMVIVTSIFSILRCLLFFISCILLSCLVSVIIL